MVFLPFVLHSKIERHRKWKGRARVMMWKSNVTSFDPRMLCLVGVGFRDTVCARFSICFADFLAPFTPIWPVQLPVHCRWVTANYCCPLGGCRHSSVGITHGWWMIWTFPLSCTPHCTGTPTNLYYFVCTTWAEDCFQLPVAVSLFICFHGAMPELDQVWFILYEPINYFYYLFSSWYIRSIQTLFLKQR